MLPATIRTITALTAPLALLALGGCAWSVTVATPSAAGTAQELAADAELEFGPGTAPVSARRTGAMLALYGETISDDAPASSFGDGSANISQMTYSADGADFDPHIDPSGEWIYYASTQHRSTADLYRKRLDGSTITQLTSDPADDMMPGVSPDGKLLAFCSNRAGNFDIYIMPVDGGQPRIITTDPAAEIHPSFSPDGRHLAYCKYNEQNGRWEIWIVEVENPTVKHFIDYGFLPKWCPDPAQQKILFQRARSRGSRYHSIWTIDLVNGQGRNPTEIISAANAALINPAWAPNAEHIVFVSVVEPESEPEEAPSQSDLWLVRLDGTGRVNLTNGEHANYQPCWGRNGEVIFVSDRSGHENLWMVSAKRALEQPRTPAGGGFATVPGEN